MGRPVILILILVVAGAWWWIRGGESASLALEPPQVIGRKGRTSGRFFKPRAIAIDPRDSSIYVVDRSGRIQYFAEDGTHLNEWELPDFANGQPVGLEVEADGTLLVNDSHYSRILRYAAGGKDLLMSWGTPGTGPGEFRFGRDVVVDSDGNVYAGDYGDFNDRIHKFSPQGEFILQFGSRGEGPGQFWRPQGMTIEERDGVESLLVTDCGNHRLQRFSLEGEFLTSFGQLGEGPGEFRYPYAVATDSQGHLYVCEWGNNRIQKMLPDGKSLGFWGGPGSEPGELGTPWDVEVGPDDRIHVVDYGNHRVQIFRWPLSQPDAVGTRERSEDILDAEAERSER